MLPMNMTLEEMVLLSELLKSERGVLYNMIHHSCEGDARDELHRRLLLVNTLIERLEMPVVKV